MSGKGPEYTGEVRENINPEKTALAIRKSKIPPLICLVCSKSDEMGGCGDKGADVELVKARWQEQFVVNPDDFQESLIPDTPLIDICSEYLLDNIP